MFLGLNAEKFHPGHLTIIKAQLEKMDDDEVYLILATEFKNPSTILLIAIFLGIERFWLDAVVSGVIKLILMFLWVGLVWWLIDIFTAKARARTYNFKKISRLLMINTPIRL